jgi:hypothetical protein
MSLLREVNSEVLPLNIYAQSPMMMPVLEIFLELLLWNSSKCRRHIPWMSSIPWNFRPFKADFISENSQKSFGAKLGVPFQ